MGIREELLKTIEVMDEEDLKELLEYAKWLQADEEGPNQEEQQEKWSGGECRDQP